MDALCAQFAGSPVGSHIAYKQLRCSLHGNGPSEGAGAANSWLPLSGELSA